MGELTIHHSGYRLLTLLALCWQQRQWTVTELIEALENDTSIRRCISEDTLDNYLKTLRQLGMTITRRHHFVQVNNVLAPPCVSDLQQQLYSALNRDSLNLSETTRHALTIFDRIFNRQTNQISLEPDFEPHDTQVARWRHFCVEGQQLKILIQNTTVAVITPLSLVSIRNHHVLLAWDNTVGLPKQFPLLDLTLLEQLPFKRKPMLLPSVLITFRLTGNLAKNYQLYPQEVFLLRSVDYIEVVNRCEDATALARRLLRYQQSCVVLQPTAFRQLIVSEIKQLMVVND